MKVYEGPFSKNTHFPHRFDANKAADWVTLGLLWDHFEVASVHMTRTCAGLVGSKTDLHTPS